MAGTIDGATLQGQAKVTFMRGLLSTCREAVWRVPSLLGRLSELIGNWTEEEFLEALPELRLSFADLTPREIDRVAEQVAAIHGQADLGDLVHADIAEADVAFHLRINQAVGTMLAEQGPASWASLTAEAPGT